VRAPAVEIARAEKNRHCDVGSRACWSRSSSCGSTGTWLRGPIERKTYEKTGRELAIHGDLS
jgi:hypothetical protein